LIKSIPGLWHPDWRPDVLERAIRSAGGLAYVWMEGDEVVGFACAHDVGFLAYLSLLAVTESARGPDSSNLADSRGAWLLHTHLRWLAGRAWVLSGAGPVCAAGGR
jgi:hypothetical protein